MSSIEKLIQPSFSKPDASSNGSQQSSTLTLLLPEPSSKYSEIPFRRESQVSHITSVNERIETRHEIVFTRTVIRNEQLSSEATIGMGHAFEKHTHAASSDG